MDNVTRLPGTFEPQERDELKNLRAICHTLGNVQKIISQAITAEIELLVHSSEDPENLLPRVSDMLSEFDIKVTKNEAEE